MALERTYNSLAEWEEAQKKKKKNQEEPKRTSNSLSEWEEAEENDIAPVKGGNKDSVFKSGGFSDGVDGVGDFLGDLGETVLGTVGDIGLGIVRGAGRLVEGVTDLGLYGASGLSRLFGADEEADRLKEAAQKNTVDALTQDAVDYVDQYSVLGNKADMVTEGLGQVGAIILTGGAGAAGGLGTLGTTALTTGVTGLSGMGSGMSEAYEQGATDEEAFTYGLISGTAEAATELLFGGLGKASKAIGIGKSAVPLDDLLAKKVTSKFSSQIAKNFTEYGIKASAEGAEEVLSGILQAVGKKATYMDEKEFNEILQDENLLEQFVVGAVTSGIAQSGVVPGMKAGSLREANKTGRDFITGYTKSDQTIIDNEVASRVAEKEKNGKKLTKGEIGKIEEQVQSDLEKGYISVDTIESTFGGDAYTNYKNEIDTNKKLKAELDELRKIPKGEMNDIQTDRLAELKGMNLDDTTKRDGLRKQLDEVLEPHLKYSTLAESYNEDKRRKQGFSVDLEKIDEKQRATYERAMNSGVVNNTNRSKEFVSVLAKIEADKGITFDFADNDKLKESGFAISEGTVINGFSDKKKGSVTINVESSKALNYIVGHEITHVLEGTEAYNGLREALYAYAESKGELEGRKANLTELYKDMNADIDAELTADLVGDYLFSDNDFIKHLTGNENVFKRIYNEIKYLCKVATGKQLTEVERVKREFDKVWKEYNSNKKVETANMQNANPAFSISTNQQKADADYMKAVENGDMETAQRLVEETADSFGYSIRAYHGTARGDRVGNVFLPERATSGPMAYFTDDKTIAENYSKSKQDTSMAYDPDYDRYETQFRIKTRDGKNDLALYSAWAFLPNDAKKRITEKAGQLREDWDGDYDLILDPETNEGNGGFQWQLKEARGNAIKALNEQWLNSGTLFNEESRFLDVLEMAGVTEEFKKIGMDNLYYKDPNAKHEKVYDTFLKITNPFDTANVTEEFATELENWYEEQDQSKYERETSNADLWDKNNITAYDFANRLRSDIENNTTHAWTSIPDSVTDFLKTKGYDGIKDKGGKFSDISHTVYIPFSSEQIKSAEPVTYDNNGNAITLSERFNTGNNDIRYSLSKEGETSPFGTPATAIRYEPTQESVVETESDVSTEGNVVAEDETAVEEIAPTVTEKPKESNLPNFAENQIANYKETIAEANAVQDAKVNADNAIAPQPQQPKINRSGETIIGESQIATKEPQKTTFKDKWKTFVRSFVDKGSVFETESLKSKTRALMDKYKVMGRSETKAQYFMQNGKGNVKSLESVRQKAVDADLELQFDLYMKHRHNIARMKYKKPVFDRAVTADVSQRQVAVLENQYPVFKEWANDVYSILNYARQMYVRAGIITQETANKWAEKYPDYVPIERLGFDDSVQGNTNGTGVAAPTKWATGGNQQMETLFKTLAHKIEKVYRDVDKNNFGLELMKSMGGISQNNDITLDEFLDTFESTEDGVLQVGVDGSNPSFSVYQNGKRVTFEITKEMYEALKPTAEGLTHTSKILNTASNLHKKVLTEYNLFFAARNAIKDAQDVLINSQHAAKTYANMPQAIKELLKGEGEFIQEYLENGGEQNTYFDKTKNAFEEEKSTFKKIVGLPFEGISKVNNFIEAVPRLAEYIASRKSGATIEAAMLDAARVTTDFSAGGDVTKFLNRNGATFLNASVQGAAQQVRNIREAKANGLKGVLKLASKYAVAGLPAVLLNSLMWEDDEEYEELSDYVKDNYYIVGKYGDGEFVRIPKGRTVAVIQEIFEQIGKTGAGEETDWGNVFTLAASNLAPNNPLDNNVIAPLIQAATNKTWYGDDLVPTRLQDVPASEQYDETIDSISKWLGENTGLSPYKINYVLNQYSGVVGDIVLPALTPEAERGDVSGLGYITAPVKDQFTVDGAMKNQNISDFYDKADELKVNANSMNATDEDILKNKYMNAINTELGDLYKQKRKIQNSSLSDQEKYEQVRNIQKQINDIAKTALETYENVNAQGNYAIVGDKHYRLNDYGEWTKVSETKLEKYSGIAKVVGGYSTYFDYAASLSDIHADKDEFGDTITGSRKEKVLNYINGLDADYETKLILFKSQYPSDDTYNHEIINYLNEREDISYEEMVSILTELGFTVKGNDIYWD